MCDEDKTRGTNGLCFLSHVPSFSLLSPLPLFNMLSFPLLFALFSGALVNAQVTGTFPQTPLASKTGFSYPSNIVSHRSRPIL